MPVLGLAEVVGGAPARRSLGLLPVAILAVAIFALAAFYAGGLLLAPIDDAFITLRYAQRFLDGLGLTYQGTQASEGFSSPLAFVWKSFGLALGLGPLPTLVSFSALPWLAMAVMVGWRSRFAGWLGWIWCSLATAALSFQPGALLWMHSGMDVGIYCLAVVVHFECQLRRVGPLPSALAAFVALLARPEGVLLIALGMLGAKSWKERGIEAGLFACLLAATTGLRLAITGLPLPLTFYAKLGNGDSSALLARGWSYVAHGLTAHVPMLVLAGLLSLCLRGRVRILTALYVFVLLGQAVLMGGDHFAGYRFCLPAFVLLQYAASGAGSELLQRAPKRLAWVLPLLWAAAAFVTLQRGFGAPANYSPGVSTLRRAYLEASYAREWTRLGLALRRSTQPGDTLGAVAIGALGYYSGRDIYDPHGLVNPDIALREQSIGAGLPGHEKFSTDHALQAGVDLWVLFNLRSTRPMTLEETLASAWGEFAQELGARPEFHAQYELFALPDGSSYWNLFRRRREPK